MPLPHATCLPPAGRVAACAPVPPPTSTTVPTAEKSYAAATARTAGAVCAAMAWSKTAPASGCRRWYAKRSTPCTWSNAGAPVRTLWRSCPQDRQSGGPPTSSASGRSEAGASRRSGSASGVRANRPSSVCANTPSLASSRSTRASDGACAPAAAARSSALRAPPASRSARPSSAAA